jgi:hypothetical protein
MDMEILDRRRELPGVVSYRRDELGRAGPKQWCLTVEGEPFGFGSAGRSSKFRLPRQACQTDRRLSPLNTS